MLALWAGTRIASGTRAGRSANRDRRCFAPSPNSEIPVCLIAAYNSGPDYVSHLHDMMMKFDDNLLLYIATLPSLQTRLLIRRVLSNL